MLIRQRAKHITVTAFRHSAGRDYWGVLITRGSRQFKTYRDEQKRRATEKSQAEALAQRIREMVEAGADYPDLLALFDKHPVPESLRNEELQERWHEEYKSRMLDGARRRAAKKGIPFSITRADLPIPDQCPVLGLILKPSRDGAGRNDNAPSIDRIRPELGYVPGNVVVVSWRANQLKLDGTAQEFRRIANWLQYMEALPPLPPQDKKGRPAEATAEESKSPKPCEPGQNSNQAEV